jgi:DeoR/GlpR family transcriptional regulator of sugar metabolism
LFAQERHAEIMKILNKDGKVIVKKLSKQFNVTQDCIRKDLTLLESQDLLQKTYGGAVPTRINAQHDSIHEHVYHNKEAKQIMAAKAFALIEDDETIFLDISTTNILLAERLLQSGKQLSIVTNMLDIVWLLNQSDNSLKVICTGGMLSRDLGGFTGATARENIASYRLSKAFIGSTGVDVTDKSVTTFDAEDGAIKKVAMKHSKKTYLLLENSKFYADGPYTFAHLHNMDAIITDVMPNKEILSALAKSKTSII